ncbi:MAG: phosphatidate cytidylyltransferase [Planctomycetota bacterium]|nr:phosphatidate cytidylyltransferase [Planctomycetota bacterium]
MLRYRILTGGVLIGLLVALVFLDRLWPQVALGALMVRAPAWWIAGTVVAIIGGAEVGRLVGRGSAPSWVGPLGAAAGVATVLGLSGGDLSWGAAGVFVALMIAALAAITSGESDRGTKASVTAFVSFLWLGVSLGCWASLVGSQGAATAAYAIMVVKATDIGAYVTGTAIGRHKLAPWLSPGKTWEGLAGGAVFAAVGAVAISQCSLATPLTALTWQHWLLFAALAAIAGPAGDLFESLLKRSAGAKDSGRCFPGMGGILDVVDSLTITGPLALAVLRQACDCHVPLLG